MANTIWFPVKLIKQFDSYKVLNNAVNLYVKITENGFTIWDGYFDFEHLTIEEAITHLQAIRDSNNKPIKIDSDALELKWFKCIYQNNNK